MGTKIVQNIVEVAAPTSTTAYRRRTAGTPVDLKKKRGGQREGKEEIARHRITQQSAPDQHGREVAANAVEPTPRRS